MKKMIIQPSIITLTEPVEVHSFTAKAKGFGS